MSEEFLNGADVVAAFEEVRGKRVAKRVTAGWLGKANGKGSVPHGPLQRGLMKVVAVADASLPIDVASRCREEPLPWPLTAGVRELAIEGVGKANIAADMLGLARVYVA